MMYYLYIKSLFDEVSDIEYETEAETKEKAVEYFQTLLPSWPVEYIERYTYSDDEVNKSTML